MKKALIMIIAVTLTGVLALTAWSSHEDETESIDEVVVQELRELEMKANFLEELGWDAILIEVEIDGGNVVLSGEVQDPVTKKMAKQIAKSSGQNIHVKNRIEINDDTEETSETPVADAVAKAEVKAQDALLETRVKTKLLSELGRHAFGVNVEAIDGVVSLRGDVPDEERHEIALETARDCKGVENVIDLLEIKDA